MDNNAVKRILRTGTFYQVDKNIIFALGAEASILVACIADGEEFALKEWNGKPEEYKEKNPWDGYFYQTAKTIHKYTGMTAHRQAKAIEVLKEWGIIKQKNKGVPMKRYFKIVPDNLGIIMSLNLNNVREDEKQSGQFLDSIKSSLEDVSKVVTRHTNANKDNSYKDNTNKETFNKLKEEDKSSLDATLGNLMEKEQIPSNKNKIIPTEDYKSLTTLLNKWKERPEGTLRWGAAHKLSSADSEQSSTVMSIYKGFTEACTDLLAFYDKHVDKFYPLWVTAHNINRASIEKALEGHTSKELVAKTLRRHLDALHSGVEKEGDWELSNSLQSFFMVKRTNTGAIAKTSWLFYWLCKEDSIAIKEEKKLENAKPSPKLFTDLEHKFHMYEGMYKKFEKLFGESDDTTLLTEAYITTLKAVEEVSESNYIKPIEAFNTVFKPMVEAIHWMDNLNPKAFMPGRKMWVDFIHKYKDSNSFVKNAVNKYIRISNNDIEEIK